MRNRSALIPLLSEAFVAPDGRRVAGAPSRPPRCPARPSEPVDEVFASPEGAAALQEVDDPVRGPLRLVADPIHVDGVVPPVRLPPPRLGEHTDQVLSEIERDG